ncbi:MAG: 50S ribosomal protein L11 methyltransferase [Flavobacteriaceae bacterium]
MTLDQTYLEFTFTTKPLQPTTDILMAHLGEMGFESFVETREGLLAYIKKGDFDMDVFHGLPLLSHSEFEISFNLKEIEQQNWNAAWEENFNPIVIDEKCAVRAPFHEPFNVPHEIVIEPKMSFGTGHHQTTHMMLQYILEHDFEGKSVLDMGCGTGVLAILADMKGARSIDAIDIDTWSYENAVENVARNHRCRIRIYQGDASLLVGKKYDVILANINRNILLQDIPVYAKSLMEDGLLFVSGFYWKDIPLITEKCNSVGLRFEKNIQKDDWVSVKYVNWRQDEC